MWPPDLTFDRSVDYIVGCVSPELTPIFYLLQLSTLFQCIGVVLRGLVAGSKRVTLVAMTIGTGVLS